MSKSRNSRHYYEAEEGSYDPKKNRKGKTVVQDYRRAKKERVAIKTRNLDYFEEDVDA